MGLGNSYRSNDHRESVYEFSIPDRSIWSEIRAPAVLLVSFFCLYRRMKIQIQYRSNPGGFPASRTFALQIGQNTYRLAHLRGAPNRLHICRKRTSNRCSCSHEPAKIGWTRSSLKSFICTTRASNITSHHKSRKNSPPTTISLRTTMPNMIFWWNTCANIPATVSSEKRIP